MMDSKDNVATAIVGYNANPSLVEVVFYCTFLVAVLALYFRRAPEKPGDLRKNGVTPSVTFRC